MDDLELIRGIKAKIPTHRQWCKGETGNGLGRMCLMGAAVKVIRENGEKGEQLSRFHLGHRLSRLLSLDHELGSAAVTGFNDNDKTTHKDVMAKLNEAEERLSGKAA